MKKNFLFFSLVLMLFMGTITLTAANYNHSIGASIGSDYGFSYKGFLGGGNLALQADMFFRISGSTGKFVSKYKDNGQKTTYKDNQDWLHYWTFEANPKLLYQGEIHNWNFGSISWFAGAGLSVGMMKATVWTDVDDFWGGTTRVSGTTKLLGKFGFGTIGGAELHFNNIPLAVNLDFRPGYGLGFRHDKENNVDVTSLLHFFDWGLVATARYCF